MEKTEIRDILKNLDSSQDQLSQYQLDFVKGLKRYFRKYKNLTPRQQEALTNIARTLSAIKS